MRAIGRAKVVGFLNSGKPISFEHFGRVFLQPFFFFYSTKKRSASAVHLPATIAAEGRGELTIAWLNSTKASSPTANINAQLSLGPLDDATEPIGFHRDTSWLASRSMASRRQSPSPSLPRQRSVLAMPSSKNSGARKHSRAHQTPRKGMSNARGLAAYLDPSELTGRVI